MCVGTVSVKLIFLYEYVYNHVCLYVNRGNEDLRYKENFLYEWMVMIITNSNRVWEDSFTAVLIPFYIWFLGV